MISITKLNKGLVGLASVFTFCCSAVVHADQINISVNNGTPIVCEYSIAQFTTGDAAELNIIADGQGNTCTIGNGGSNNNGNTLPTPSYPVGLIEENGVPVKKPFHYKWKKVDGATHYIIEVYAGGSASGTPIYSRSMNLSGNASQQASYNNYCEGSSDPDYCIISNSSPLIYYTGSTTTGTTGTDLMDGSYFWQVRVGSGEFETNFSDATANFIVNTEVQTEAVESAALFADAWVNQRYDPQTGANNFVTKTQLVNMLDTAPYNSYQEIAGNKKVYIVNNSINAETVIPSCVNGKNKNPEGQTGSTCSVDIPFELNEIYALRLKTRDLSQSGSLIKSSNQLYSYEGAIYNIAISKFPGRMTANQSDDFQGTCSATSFSLLGEFSLLTSENGSPLAFCNVPDDTQFYVNVELASDQTQCLPGQNTSGYVCQIDIKLNGFASPNN